MELLLGKAVAEKIKNQVRDEVSSLVRKPCLCVLLNKDDASSKGYAASLVKVALNVGINVYVKEVESSYESYEKEIQEINDNCEIDACLITRPLGYNLDEKKIFSLLNPLKDADAASAYHLGKILCDEEEYVPNTAKAIIKMLEYYNIPLKGKKVLVVGRSLSVGKPVAMMLLNRHATVTIAHSRSENLEDDLINYDIVVAAVGKPHLLDAAKMKDGAVVIDAGIHYLENEIIGDVKPAENLSFISKVPGGVGIITSACLMENVLKCYWRNHHDK